MAELLEKNIDPNIIEFKSLTDGDSPRGLEYANPATLAYRNRRYANAITAVMVSQRVCSEMDLVNAEDEIAWAYSEACQSAAAEALETASIDAQFVIDHVRKSIDYNQTEELRTICRRRRSSRPTSLLRRTRESRMLCVGK